MEISLSQKEQIAKAIEGYIQQHSITQSALAELANVNPSYLINIRKGDFTIKSGDRTIDLADKYFMRLAKTVGIELTQSYSTTQQTIQLKEIITALNEAKNTSETVVLVGETGSGKTFSLDLFKSKFPVGVFSIKAGSSDNLADLIEKILDALNIKYTLSSKSSKIRQIAMKLKNLKDQGINPQLVIDEAEYLKQPALCAWKELYDVLHMYCSLVLIGTDQLIQNINRLIKKNKQGIAQLWRRIKFKVKYLTPISRRFDEFLVGIDRELKDWLQANCENYGELTDVLTPAKREADRLDESLNLGFVKMVLSL